MVVGNSHGGWVAAWMAVDHADRVNKLMLVDSAGLESQKAGTQEVSKWFDGSVAGLKEFQKRSYFRPRELPEAVWSKAAARLKTLREKMKAAHPELEQVLLAQERLDAHLGAIRANTLVFWGKEDRITFPEAGREFTQRIRGARLREAPECGHLPQKECPAALMKALNEWVQYGGM
jgi:pimeloyl-ACP methyl ester carboxylesterase